MLIVMAAAITVSAADDQVKKQNFRAGEIQVETFGVLDRPDLTGAPVWGAGVGVGYYITRGLGASVRGVSYSTDEWGGSVIDQGEARILFRAPLWDRVAPYGYVAGIHNFERDDWGAGAGGGLEYRLTQRIGVFGETGLGITTKRQDSWSTSFGLRIAF